MSTHDQWSIQKIRSTFQHRFGPPQPPSNTTILVYHRGSCIGQMGPHIQKSLNWNDCRLGLYEFWIIPTGSRTTRLNEQVATNQVGVAFTVNVEIQYQVNEPEKVARAHETTLPDDVNKELQRMIQQHAGRYGPLEWEALKQAIESDMLRRRQLSVGVETMNPLVKVTLDSKVVEHRREAFVIRDQGVVRQAQIDRDRAELLAAAQTEDFQLQLDLARQNREATVAQVKMERYARVLTQGKVEQFAALLVEPDNATLREIVQNFEDQRNTVVAERWKFFKEMINSDDSSLIARRIQDAMKALGMIDRPLLQNDTNGNNNPSGGDNPNGSNNPSGSGNKPKNRQLFDDDDSDDDDEDKYGWMKDD